MTRTLLRIFVAMLLSPAVALADYARPPDDRERADDEWHPRAETEGDWKPASTVRLFTGPSLKFAEEDVRGGLALSLDAGARGAGARFCASWIRAGSDHGLSEYAADVWIDFADRDVLHPILGAGAAIARLDRASATNSGLESETIGVGELRGTLQYRLPVHDVDARAALDVVGSVPAVGAHVGDVTPWVTAALMVGIGL